MAMIGNLQEFALPDLLQLLDKGSKSGQLSIWAPNGIYRVWLHQGKIVTAISPEPAHRLLQTLSKNESINGSILANLISTSNLAEPLGTLLRRQNAASPVTLVKLFRQQLEDGVYCLFSLESGQFNFVSDMPLPYLEMTGISKSAMEVALEGLRKMEFWNFVNSKLPAPDSVLIRLTSEVPLLQLSPLEWQIWEGITPDLKLSDFSQKLQVDLQEVRQACARLIRMGLIDNLADVKSARKSSQPLPRFGQSDGELKGSTATTVEVVPSSTVPIETPASVESIASAASPQSTTRATAKDPTAKDPTGKVNTSLLIRLASVLRGIR